MLNHTQIPGRRIAWPSGHEPESAVVFAHNAVDISASPHKVWSLLIDCIAWPRWYKHCSDVTILRGGSTLQPDAKLRFKTLQRYFEPEIVRFDPCRMPVWSAKGPVGTSGSHAWFIEPTMSGCRVITEEVQKGLLLLALGKRVRNELLASHENWVQSLKVLAETK